MGCFSSKEAQPEQKTQSAATLTQAPIPTPAAPVAAPAKPRQKIVITEVDKAKHKLKHQRDALEQSIRKSEEVVLRDMKLARTFLDSGKTESAKVLLRRRRLVQKQIAASVAQLDAVENSIGTIEGTEATATVLDAIEGGTKALETLNKSVTVERAEQVMRESEDALAYTEEVSRALGHLEDAPEIDDAEVLAELEMFEKANGISAPAQPVAVSEKTPAVTAEDKVDAPEQKDAAVEQGEEEQEEGEEEEHAVAPVAIKKSVAVPA